MLPQETKPLKIPKHMKFYFPFTKTLYPCVDPNISKSSETGIHHKFKNRQSNPDENLKFQFSIYHAKIDNFLKKNK